MKQKNNSETNSNPTPTQKIGFSLVTQLVNHSNIFFLRTSSICNERRNQRNQRHQPNRQWCIAEVREEYQVSCFKSYVWSDIDCCRFWHLLAASKEESTLKLQNLWLSFVERYQDVPPASSTGIGSMAWKDEFVIVFWTLNIVGRCLISFAPTYRYDMQERSRSFWNPEAFGTWKATWKSYSTVQELKPVLRLPFYFYHRISGSADFKLSGKPKMFWGSGRSSTSSGNSRFPVPCHPGSSFVCPFFHQ